MAAADPVDTRMLRPALWRHGAGRLSDDLNESLGDEPEVLINNPARIVGGTDPRRKFRGGLADVGEPVLVTAGQSGNAATRM